MSLKLLWCVVLLINLPLIIAKPHNKRKTPSEALDLNQKETENIQDKKSEKVLKVVHSNPFHGEILRKDAIEKTLSSPEQVDFEPVVMPTRFESYDVIDQDGYVTLEELVKVTGARENVKMALEASDKDGDGRLTRSEFESAPWALGGGDPSLLQEDNERQEEDNETEKSELQEKSERQDVNEMKSSEDELHDDDEIEEDSELLEGSELQEDDNGNEEDGE